MPLLENEKHNRAHKLGPKDLKFGPKRHAVAMISVVRSTIHDEQFTVSIPVFFNDTREELNDRIDMFLSLAQDRRDDAQRAWEVAEENQERIDLQKKAASGKLTEAEKKRHVELTQRN